MRNMRLARALAQMIEHAGSSSNVRFDANETAFLERELTQLRAKLYEVQYADNMAMSFVPLATDIAPDAKTYSTPVLDRTGHAKIIGNGVKDIPRVDIKKDEILGQVYTIADAYGFELMELRNAARLNLPIEMWKAQNARAAIDDEIDQVLAFGETFDQAFSLNVSGLANNSAVGVDTSSFTTWTSATAAATQLADLNAPAAALNVTLKNKSTLMPNTMVMPSSYYDIASTTPVGNTSDLSVLNWFLANNPYIKEVRQWNKLATANAAGTGPRILVYRKSPLVLEGVAPLLFEQLPPQPQGLELVTNCIARCGGVKIYHPEAMSYVDPT